MKISICVGSSCHLKGSYDVIKKMQEVVQKYGVQDKIELAASFCLGDCTASVCAASDDGLKLHHLNADNAEEIFVREVLPKVK